MTALNALPPSIRGSSPELESGPSIPPSPAKPAFLKVVGDNAVLLEVRKMRSLGLYNGAYVNSRFSRSIKSMNDHASVSGKNLHLLSATRKSTNVTWHKCSVEKLDRQELLQQKGCVIWITGLSGSGAKVLSDTTNVSQLSGKKLRSNNAYNSSSRGIFIAANWFTKP
ncbi:hypothetical protein L484_009393 [Morus notabilis]|uniref:Adenylyl-sulfate kinase n=1 Tax=Morus notabilis TaxID=981085 RepID=W9RJI6_9ROSA|nr:hypothetical protein L484_009393 [Morus notabilis]